MSEITTVGALPPIPMTLRDGSPRVTSRDVAEIFGKNHQHVLEKVRVLDCSEAFRQSNFRQSSYVNAQNKPQPMVEMTRDGFTFLAMGFTGPRAAAFKEAFIEAFNAMEAQLRGGSALPAIAQAVTQMQAQMHALAERQAETDTKVNAILDLVDVTKRYVLLLENNQKPPRRTVPFNRITPEIERECLAMFAEGLSVTDVGMHLNIARTTAHRIKHGALAPDSRARALQAAREEVPA